MFVLEVASESTAHRDLGEKREIYARMGAQEYWRLDRDGEYYGEPLVGERLVNGEYERIELHTEANGDTWSRSEVLGVDFYHSVDDDGYGIFLLRDSVTGEWLNTLSDEIAARQAAEFRAHVAELPVRKPKRGRRMSVRTQTPRRERKQQRRRFRKPKPATANFKPNCNASAAQQ